MKDTANTTDTPTRQGNPRQQYYDRIAKNHMTPLWEVLGALVP